MSYELKRAERLPFKVSNLCFGTSALGDMPDTYGYSVSESQARETIRAIFALPNSFVDTSRNYGGGRSEERLGQVIRELGGPPEDCVIATKIDRNMETNGLNAAQARQSVEESLKALGVDRFNILHLHDPEYCSDLRDITRQGGALDALFRMKEEGLADAVGLAMGNLRLMNQLLADWEFDALVSHNRYTLLNREADSLFDAAHARGIAIFNAAPYTSGILAKGSGRSRKIAYQDATDEQLVSVRAIEALCERHRVPVGAAALQFSLNNPRITSTIIGITRPERVQQTLDWASMATTDEFWHELGHLPYSCDDPEANRIYKPG